MRPSARPIAAATDSSVLSSAADCRLTAFLSTDQATRYWIKGVGFTLATLLGNAAVAQDFDGGAMLIHRLAPQDYHRWHAPCDGTVEDVKKIPGTCVFPSLVVRKALCALTNLEVLATTP